MQNASHNPTFPNINNPQGAERSDEEYLDHYRRLSRQIDELLKRSVKTLVDVARTETKDPLNQCCDTPLYFPPWFSADGGPEVNEKRKEDKHLLTRALGCATLQKIWLYRRRFNWVHSDRDMFKQLEDLQKQITTTFRVKGSQSRQMEVTSGNSVSGTEEKEALFKNYLECLDSENFGPLNPYTASQIFRVLLHAGEGEAHRGTGFWVFFSIVGSLLRKFSEGKIRGAALEPWAPTAYITAKCLFPIDRLCSACERRAELLGEIREQIGALEKLALESSECQDYKRWLFASKLDELSSTLSGISEIVINQQAFRNCAKQIGDLAGTLTVFEPNSNHWNKVKKYIYDLLKSLGDESAQPFKEAQDAVELILSKIKERLADPGKRDELSEIYGLHLRPPKDKKDEYWNDHVNACKAALELCSLGRDNLELAFKLTKLSESDGASTETIREKLKILSKANRNFANEVRQRVSGCAAWCHSVVAREISHASAKNYTDFDPAELVSGIVTAVKWGQMTSPLEISDAIGKALLGAREDGSWSAGQPFYLSGRILAGYASTSDIIWELSSVIAQRPEITVADEALERYVQWLDRTMCRVFWKKTRMNAEEELVESWGWASERSRQSNTIDVRATALAINALFEIRGLVEYRLWQLCEKRFNRINVSQSLSSIDPVDLGAKHEVRLHRRLSKMVREAEIDNSGEAEYSFVLHGPPGSSKTVVAQALSKEMWRNLRGPGREPRLIRITPADFTRHGEDRIDSEARFIFDLLGSIRGITVLFDEVDDLLRKRQMKEEPTFIKLIVPAMLNRLADLREACPRQQICFLIGTNFIENIEPALIRPGRIDAAIPVVYPDAASRSAQLDRNIEKLKERDLRADQDLAKQLEDARDNILSDTRCWPWKALDQLYRELKRTPPDQRSIDKSLKQYGDKIQKPAYLARLRNPPECSELLNEFIHYTFANMNGAEKYTDKLPGMLKKWSEKELLPKQLRDAKDWFPEVCEKASKTWTDEQRNPPKP